MHQPEDELVKLERAGWEALSQPGSGVPFYENILTPDALMVFPVGALNRDETLDAIRRSVPWEHYRMDEVHTFRPLPTVGIVTYYGVANRPGQSDYAAWMSSVYVLVGETWKLALYQQSPTPPEEDA
jgi:Domain of unknown function (DUF4440)